MSGENLFSGMFQPVVLNTSGQISVAAGYKAKFYEAGTDIPKTIYTDPDLEVPYSAPSNIAYLDDTGKALIYLGIGGYKLVLTDPDDVPVPGYTIDNIVGGGTTFGTGFVDSFADLVNVNTTIFPYTYIGGYFTPGDGGEGMFYNATSSTAVDGGYVQESEFDPSKRWFRISDENGDVRAASFGYCGSGDKTSNLQAADSYAYSIGARLRLAKVSCTATSVTLNSARVVPDEQAQFIATSGGAYTITLSGVLEAAYFTVFSGWENVFLNGLSQESNPYWFGGSPDNSADDNATAFTRWLNAGAGLFVLPAGSWKHTGTFTPSTDTLTLFFGPILDGDGPTVAIKPGTNYGPGSELTGDLSLDISGGIVMGGGLSLGGDITFSNTKKISPHLGDGIEVDGTVDAESFRATADVTAQGDVAATGGVSGGSVVSGSTVSAIAGASGIPYNAAGARQVVIGTGDASLDANTLTADNTYIRIICMGTTTSATPTVTVTIDGTTVFSSSLSVGSGAAPYFIQVLVFKTGTGTSFSTGFATFGANSAGFVATTDFRTAAVDWTTSNVIAHSASATNVKKLTMYEVYP